MSTERLKQEVEQAVAAMTTAAEKIAAARASQAALQADLEAARAQLAAGDDADLGALADALDAAQTHLDEVMAGTTEAAEALAPAEDGAGVDEPAPEGDEQASADSGDAQGSESP